MDEVLKFLKDVKTYYLATVDGDGNAQLRPFGTITKFNDALYIQTGNVKKVYKELESDARISICAMSLDGKSWLRLTADAICEPDNRDARIALLEEHPSLKGIYDADDGNCEAVRLANVHAEFCSFVEAPRVIEF